MANGFGSALGGGAAENIIRRTSELITVPISDLDPTIPGGIVPNPGFATAVISAPGVPERGDNPYAPPSVEVPGEIAGSIVAPMYRALNSVLSYTPLPESILPEYVSPVLPSTPPKHESETPPIALDYATQPGLATQPGVGGIDVEVPHFAPRRELYKVSSIPYSPTVLQPFDTELPPAEVPPAPELEAPTLAPIAGTDLYIATLQRVFTGVDPFNSTDEEALYTGAVAGIDRRVYRATEQLAAAAAAKGHTRPPPEMIAGVVQLGEQAQQAGDEASERTSDEILQARVELRSSAAGASAQLEGAFIQRYAAEIEALVETQRLNVAMAKSVFDSALAILEEKQRIQSRLMDSYRRYTATLQSQERAALAVTDIKQAQASTYASEVAMFEAQSGTAAAAAEAQDLKVRIDTLPVEEYNIYVSSAEASRLAARTNMAMFADAIRAYEEYIQTDIEAINAATAEMSATASAAALDRANLATRQAHTETEAARSGAAASLSTADVRAIEAALGTYRTYSESYRQYLTVIQQRMDAEASMVNRYASTVGELAQYTSAWNEAEAARKSAENSLNLSLAEQVSRQQALTAQAEAANSRIEAGRLGAEANMAANAAQSAYGISSSMLHVRGGTGAQNTSSDTDSEQFADSAARSWSKKRTTTIQTPT